MFSIIVKLSKYLLIILFAVFTYLGFAAMRKKTESGKSLLLSFQRFMLLFIHLLAYTVIYIQKDRDTGVIIFYLVQLIFFVVVFTVYYIAYPKASMQLVNLMCMFMAIGFIMISRLNYDRAIKQVGIAIVSVVASLLVPLIISKSRDLRRFKYLYAGVGAALLCVVAVLGRLSYGAKLSFSIAGISFQPSEFVKIIFVFFVAASLYSDTSIKSILITSAIALFYILVLIASKDLGAAMIFFFVYLVMLYVATKEYVYSLVGLAVGAVAAVAAYFMFTHVRTRVIAWLDPFSVVNDEGYQVAQSLFAIGTGGWFGSGLFKGRPNDIPVVEEDYIFSAISEEMGGIFAICLIFCCMCCLILFINIAMQLKDRFYKLVALGLGTAYGFQVFVTIGGVTKFIPSTGVTLPLISYGGSSLLATLVVFAIIQGLYIRRTDEEVSREKRRPGPRNTFDEAYSADDSDWNRITDNFGETQYERYEEDKETEFQKR
ncbi:MAG: FtsW/RodA/SpoVE family cell cycle protein [Lachnospiraceae bacterium]|nr:FtsW/RodA/SpoVE family cell cycle protein [Lachnospiraceae bacterium]